MMSNMDGREGSSQHWWAGGDCLILFGMERCVLVCKASSLSA